MVERYGVGLAVAMLLASSLAVAQLIELRKYSESEDPNTPVSGHAVVGVSIAPKKEEQEQSTLSVWLPRGRQGQVLKVDVTTASGRVQGEALVQLESGPGDKPAPQWLKLNVPRKYRKSDPEGLTVSVRTPDDPAIYIASWGDTERKPLGASSDSEEVWFYVNRGRSPQAFLYADDTTGIPCVPVQSASQLRYNTICKVKVGQVRAANGKLKVVRRDGGSTRIQEVVLAW